MFTVRYEMNLYIQDMLIFFSLKGCATTGTVGRWPPTAEARFRLQVDPSEISGKQIGTGRSFFSV